MHPLSRSKLFLTLACALAATSALPAYAQVQNKEGTIKSVDARAKTFFLERDPLGLTFTVDDKTVITLDGKPSTFAEALKPELKVAVTYTTLGTVRTASKVNVTGNAAATRPAPAPVPTTRPIAETKPAPAAVKPGDYAVTKSHKVAGEGRWEPITLDAQGKFLYIPRNGRTQVMDTTTGTVVGEVLGKGPARGIALAPAVNRGFITNERENTVTVFDLNSFAVLGKIPVDGLTASIAYDTASKRILVCCVEGKCLVPIAPDIDLKTGKPEPAIELDGRPGALTTDGQGTAYVDILDTDEIAVIDTKAMSLLTKWPMGNSIRPTGISMDEQRTRLFVGFRNLHLAVLSVVDGHEIARVQLPALIESTAFSNGKVFAMAGDGTLFVIAQDKTGKYELQQTLKLGEGAAGMAADSRTGTVYVPSMDVVGHRTIRDTSKILVLEKK